MVSGIGVDIVRVERFSKYTLDSSFCMKIFTQGEREYLIKKPAESLAGLFAAKEAVSKAIGTGIRGFSFTDIEIYHDEYGKPLVRLHGRARELAGESVIHISISHTAQDAVAFAVIS